MQACNYMQVKRATVGSGAIRASGASAAQTGAIHCFETRGRPPRVTSFKTPQGHPTIPLTKIAWMVSHKGWPHAGLGIQACKYMQVKRATVGSGAIRASGAICERDHPSTAIPRDIATNARLKTT